MEKSADLESLKNGVLKKLYDPREIERARKVFDDYGPLLRWDVTNVLLHAIDKKKVDEVLAILEKHYREELSYQHPEIRGTVGAKTGAVLVGICRDTLGLEVNDPS